MILQALNRYYDILVNDPNSGIPLLGYSSGNISFVLNISIQGELLDIFSLFDTVQRGKKTVEVPRKMNIPEQVKRTSSIEANFLCDNCTYVLGISSKEGDDPEYSITRFKAFKEKNIKILETAHCAEANAVINFLKNYDPQNWQQNSILVHYKDELLKGGNIIFKLEGEKGYIHENIEIRRAWELYRTQSSNDYKSQCLVTGDIAPIARLHPSIKGVKDTNSTGATLVGFNARAYESYNKTEGQGLNSPVSEKAAFGYTTALNYLLSSSNKNKRINLGDTTIIYWAESTDNIYAAIVAGLFASNWSETEQNNQENNISGRDNKGEQRLREIAEKIKNLQAVDVNMLMEGLNPNTNFYILGLSPNAARISVRFFHRDTFQKIVQKIMCHYEDMSIIKEFDNQPSMIPLWRIFDETVSKKSSDKKASPLMAGAVFRSILNNSPYPAALYFAILNRIRSDIDDAGHGISKINYYRAAVVKAYLIRKYCYQDQPLIKEVLTMSLNEQSTNQSYLLGRLFAVLEKAQLDAAKPAKLNSTIKDRYFSSACATPSSVFPVLLRLSQHHISKAEYGYANDKRIEEIMDLLDVNNNPIPDHLSLDEQGIFVLGYYHQRAAFFKSKENIDNQELISETTFNN